MKRKSRCDLISSAVRCGRVGSDVISGLTLSFLFIYLFIWNWGKGEVDHGGICSRNRKVFKKSEISGGFRQFIALFRI